VFAINTVNCCFYCHGSAYDVGLNERRVGFQFILAFNYRALLTVAKYLFCSEVRLSLKIFHSLLFFLDIRQFSLAMYIYLY